MLGVKTGGIAMILALTVALSGCAALFGNAKSDIDKAIGAAVAQKRLVEAVMVEVIKLHIVGRITDKEYADAEDAYNDWYHGEIALAKSLAAWKTVASKGNGDALNIDLDQVADLAGAFLSFAGRFVDLDAIQKRVGATLSRDDQGYSPHRAAALEPVHVGILRGMVLRAGGRV